MGAPHVQVSPGSFYINYRARGGVQGFRYRLDDQRATAMQLPGRINEQAGLLQISGDGFRQILPALALVYAVRRRDQLN
jgi:hypothetical protein